MPFKCYKKFYNYLYCAYPNFILLLRTMKAHVANITIELIIASLCSLVFFSCSDDERILHYQHSIQVKPYSSVTLKDTTLAYVVVRADGALVDTLYKNDESVNELFLVPNLNAESTVFEIKNNKSKDIITIEYNIKPEPITGGGGITTTLKLLDIVHTKNYIDSAVIVNPIVKYNESIENVKIYIRN